MQILKPTIMIQKPETSVKHLRSALLLGIQCPISEIDDLFDEYEQFADTINAKICHCQTVGFYKEMFGSSSRSGNSGSERGFSENKMALDQNMRERTLIARRTIKDYIR
ncbi:hypothetical protein PoB_007574300 [Plakobranchus ocellatus]|uniref:Uncharacterized protein n=1 Tax=Plakobranchus ocellatus TaxID=259542 RepID=A0AAV4DYS4_9GAST|nr:hypothetical protein PoB_007574300 [Plakobranchus ocellatus]